MRLQRLTGLEREKIVEEYRELMALIERLRAILGSDKLRARGDPAELARATRALRRQAAHRDRARDERDHDRGHDRRRGHGDHGHQHGLHQALAALALPGPGPRRQGPHRHDHQGRRLRRAPLRRLGALLRPGLHPDAAASTGSRCTRSRRPARRRRARRSSTCSTSTGADEIATSVAVRDFPEDRFLVFATEKGTIKKTRALRVRQSARRRHHRDQPRRGRPPARGQDDRRHASTSSSPRPTACRSASRRPTRRPMGRATYGVRGISLRKGDRVVGMEVARAKEGARSSPSPSAASASAPLVDEYRDAGPRRPRHDQPQGHRRRPARWSASRRSSPGDQVMLITQEGMIIRTPVDGDPRDRPLDPGREADEPRGRRPAGGDRQGGRARSAGWRGGEQRWSCPRARGRGRGQLNPRRLAAPALFRGGIR